MKKITLRIDDDAYEIVKNSARRRGLSLNALFQNLIMLGDEDPGAVEDLRLAINTLLERTEKLEMQQEKTRQIAVYAKMHSEEVIQSLIFRKDPSQKAGWEKSLQEAIERGSEVMSGVN